MTHQGQAAPDPARPPVSRRRLLAGTLALVVLGASPAVAQTPAGSWATYVWTSSIAREVSVLVQEPKDGQVVWSVARESAPPEPIFVTYSMVRVAAKSYTLQIVTRQVENGPPLSITQVTVDRASGKALRSVIQYPKGVIQTPESGLRPFSEAAVKGERESVTVPAGAFRAVRAPYQSGTVWVSDQVPVLGLAKATLARGTLELVASGASGATDLLRR